MICVYVGFSVLGAPRPIAVLLASLIASIISGDEDDYYYYEEEEEDNDHDGDDNIEAVFVFLLTMIAISLTFLP